MTKAMSKTFALTATGPLACWTRPEMKVERVSYEVMTPSGARGVLEAILWKPAIRWVVESIAVLSPIQWVAFRRNEVNSRASPRSEGIFADQDRAQRNTVALRDVRYGIRAHFELTDKAGAEDSVTKFEEMFSRRLEKGQTFHQPYLGCREFAADVSKGDEARPIEPNVNRPLGLMFYDYDFREEPPKPLFFDAELRSGVLEVPSYEVVVAANRGGA